MGCVNSRTDINDLHPNIFQVMNVDDLGNLITPGRLEVTDTDIVLYQRGKQPVNWPLRCLRRYGYDSEIFSFESGRRCSTGPGIYAFKCRRADQLFNLVQTNIQVCNNNGDTDTISRDLSITQHSGPTLTRMTIPNEPNYLDPTPIRSNSRLVTRFSHNQHNGIGRLSSAGSSSGPLSPQGTMGSPSPPPMMMPPPPPPPLQQHPSALYVNDEVLSSFTMDLENNNNKNQRRSVQRSCTLSSTTSSIGIASEIPLPPSTTTTIAQYNSDNYQNQPLPPQPPPLSAMASYMNIDISNDASPLSPSHSFSLSTLLRDDNIETDTNHAYMNINPGNENMDTTNLPVTTTITSTTSLSLSSIAAVSTTTTTITPIATISTPTSIVPLTTTTASAATTTTMTKKIKKSRPSLPTLANDYDDGSRHCYANLEPGEIENLRMMIPANTCSNDKSSLPPTTPSSESIKEVNYAILDLDKNNITTNDGNNAIPSPPDSPSNSYPQKGYATIDFNKTAALSHSVNPNVVNDNEGSRKTRHNSTINDLNSPTRQTSSISE
ncbi:fibroblast growth factor receptor substrate 2 [Aphidius gifuensis]|uniref:fibroblast growth factor receptor substrate 2 n=1 Tax=Aphidius gifuensis TaxID=684658 RepID=UPI001CDCB943|nr:fibroblast growth factor receptor substrate 2 [Aphidius gifuensis]